MSIWAGFRLQKGVRMLEFTASHVLVYKDDDAETIVSFAGEDADGKPRYLELTLLLRKTRGELHFAIKAEVGRPKRVGQDCVTSAELRRDRFVVVFAKDGSLAKIGEVRITFTVATKEYQNLKRGLQEVFCDGHLLRWFPSKAPELPRDGGRNGWRTVVQHRPI